MPQGMANRLHKWADKASGNQYIKAADLTRISAGDSIFFLMAQQQHLQLIQTQMLKTYQANESDFSQHSELSSYEIVAGKKNKNSNDKGQWTGGLWNDKEKIRYVAFILYNKDSLSSKLQRRASKVFKQMSNFIETRNPSQCRSQNQKMYKRYKTVNRIVSEFKKEIGEEIFQTAYNELRSLHNIKFYTEAQMKAITMRTESEQPRVQKQDMEVQTDPMGCVVLPREEFQMYNMFKMHVMNNFYNSNSFLSPSSFNF